MSYNTTYSLKVDNNLTFLIGELKSKFDEADYCLTYNGETSDSGRWYDHEDDLKEFSKKYPDVLFTLHGEGEDNDDVWYKYFKNGKMQVCKLIASFPPFDEKLLT